MLCRIEPVECVIKQNISFVSPPGTRAGNSKTVRAETTPTWPALWRSARRFRPSRSRRWSSRASSWTWTSTACCPCSPATSSRSAARPSTGPTTRPASRLEPTAPQTSRPSTKHLPHCAVACSRNVSTIQLVISPVGQ